MIKKWVFDFIYHVLQYLPFQHKVAQIIFVLLEQSIFLLSDIFDWKFLHSDFLLILAFLIHPV